VSALVTDEAPTPIK